MGKKEKVATEVNEGGGFLKNNLVYLILIGILFTVSYGYIFDSKINLGGDNAGYYVLGKAIKSGAGYTNIHMPDNPAHNHFPPGYPAILSAFMLFSESITFLKIVNGFFLLGSAWLLFSLVKKVTSNSKIAFVAAVLTLVNMHLLSYATIMMSEVPFLFFSLLILLLFIRSQEQQNPFKHPDLYFVILLSSFAFHIRTAGLALVGGIILYLLLRKNFKYALAYIMGFIALGIPWFLRGKSAGGGNYLNQLLMVNPYRSEEGMLDLGGLFGRIWENLGRYLGKEIPSGIFPGFTVNYRDGEELTAVLFGLFIVGVVLFAIYKLPRYKNLFLWYSIGTFGILLLWPEVWFGVRFFLPLIPIFTFLFAFGIYQVLYILGNQLNLKPSPLLLLVILIFFLPQLNTLKLNAESRYPPRFQNYFDIAEWIGANTSEDAVICCRKPTLLYLFANRKTVRYANTFDYTALLNELDSNDVNYVVVDALGFSSTDRYLKPVIATNPEKFGQLLNYPAPETYLLTYNGNLGYEGAWKRLESGISVKHGKGKMVYKNRVVEGNWVNNSLEGVATTTYTGGNTMVARYEQGKLVEILKKPNEEGN